MISKSLNICLTAELVHWAFLYFVHPFASYWKSSKTAWFLVWKAQATETVSYSHQAFFSVKKINFSPVKTHIQHKRTNSYSLSFSEVPVLTDPWAVVHSEPLESPHKYLVLHIK